MKLVVCLLFLVVANVCVVVASGFGQDIVLRDLTRIRDVEIAAIDDDGVVLSDRRKLTWDRILQARVDESIQATIDEKLKQQGLPLFRLKHRIRSGNVEGAFEVAGQFYQSSKRKLAGPEANFLICRSVMLGRIRQQKSANAVEPMIHALQLQQRCSSQFRATFADFMFRDGEMRTDICDDFVPVFGRSEFVREELERLDENFDLDELTRQYPGLAVYLSAMAIQIGQRERAEVWNAAIGSVPELRPWQRLLGRDVSRMPLSRLIDETEGSLRVTAMYWWATSDGQTASRQERLLTLLKIVAAYRQPFPDLTRRARIAAADLTDDPKLAEMLRDGEKSLVGSSSAP